MKIVHRLLGFLILVIMLGMGAMLLVASASADRWGSLTEFATAFMSSGRWSGLFAGMVLVLLGIVYVISGLGHRRSSAYLEHDRDGGQVSINMDAIAQFVAKLAVEFPSVLKMTPRVIGLKNGIDIVVSLRVKASSQIYEVCDLVQKRVREGVTTGLGIEQVRRVDVKVDEIVSEHKPV